MRNDITKRVIFWLLTTVATFALGVATAFVWLEVRNSKIQEPTVMPLTAEKTVAPAEMPILAYCELANNPEKYDGKVVRISARLNKIIHGAFFSDKNCDGRGKVTAVTLDPERADELAIDIINKFRKETKSEEYEFWDSFWNSNIIAVGRFRRVKPTGESDALVDFLDLRFEILEVEKSSE